jgi:hypothetical protein
MRWEGTLSGYPGRWTYVAVDRVEHGNEMGLNTIAIAKIPVHIDLQHGTDAAAPVMQSTADDVNGVSYTKATRFAEGMRIGSDFTR